MKKQIKYIIAIMIMFITCCGFTQDLQENLKPLSILTEKEWQGKLWSPNGSKSFIVAKTFTPIFKGKVIKMQKINYGLNNSEIGYIYWDATESKMAFFNIGNKGVYSKGYVNVSDSLITFNGIMTWPEHRPPFKQSYEIKNTLELKHNGLLIDKWSHNALGVWKEGHTIEYHYNNIKEPEIQQITKAIHSVIGWAATKDTNVLYGVIANDSNFIEVQPNKRVVFGINEFKKAEEFWLSPDFKAIGYEINDMKINLSESGDVAWFYCVLNDWNIWKGQTANWENTRWTGVLEKRNGIWKIVQQHFSYAKN